MIKKTVVSTLLMLLLSVTAVWAAPQTIITEGVYIMGDGETPAQAEEKSFLQAKRAAIEQAGTYIESYSKTKNWQLTSDEVKMIAAGGMETTVLDRQRSLEPNGSLKFTVKINCSVTAEGVDALRERLQDKAVRAEYEKALQEIENVKSDKKRISDAWSHELNKSVEIARDISFIASMAELRKDYETALELYDIALRICPKATDIMADKAILLVKYGRYDEARALCEKIKITADTNILPGRFRDEDYGNYHRVQSALNY